MAKRRRKGEYGKGTVYYRADRGTWSISYRIDGKRVSESGFETEKDAKDALAMNLGDVAAGKKETETKLASDPLNVYAKTWLADRKATHRSAYDDANRWQNHFEKTLGRKKPNEVTVAVLKDFIAAKRRTGLSTTTVNLLVRLLSTLYTDLVEAGAADANPCRQLSKKTRSTYLKAAHDPKRTPFLESMEDVIRVYQALRAKAPTVAAAYAIGALAGLRTSEVRALRWSDIDLQRGSIHVQVQVERRKGRDASMWSKDGTQQLKDGESRVVPIQPSLASVLLAWQEFAGAEGLVCPPLRAGRRRFLDDHTMNAYLRDVLKELKLAKDGLSWYEATRHTMASHFVMAGGSLETLQRILGHSTVLVTERYAHLRPGYFTIADRNRLTADFAATIDKLATKLATDKDGKNRSIESIAS